MAGEWIKLEISTPDKPEVFRMARILKIDRDAVFGKLVRFWAWMDKVSVDGVVDGVVDADVDALVDAHEFTKALVSVGWCVYDAEKERISLPNFARHNGETAKKRALKNARQARYRQGLQGDDVEVDAPPSTKASTREEKRRVKEINKESSKKFTPPTVADVQSYVDSRPIKIDAQAFVDHYEAVDWMRGKNKIKSWQACVRTWERNQHSKPNGADGLDLAGSL